MLLNEHYPSDIRVLKESRSLINAGYEITLLCLAKENQELTEKLDDMNVIRIKGSEVTWKKGLLDMNIAVFRNNPVVSKVLKSVLNKEKFDAIHVHDLPLFFTAKKASSGIPIVLDLHENYPDALSVWFKWRKNPLIRAKNNLFFGMDRWMAIESDSVESADYVVAVVDEMKERLVAQSSVEASKIHVVSNMEGRDFLDQEVDGQVFAKDEGKFIVSYTGNVGPHRGVDTLVRSMQFLKDYPDIILKIIGTCSVDTTAYLKSLIEEFDLHDKVEIWGYQPFSKFFSFMKMSDVNVIPHNKNGHTDHTIPHKLYQAMMVGKPVLVSSCKPLKRVVESVNSGLVFEAENDRDAADKLISLYTDKGLYEASAKRGFEATLNGGLNWENEGENLISLYEEVVK